MQHRERILYATLLLISGTCFSKVLGFGRELLFIHRFGASAVSDAFLLTNGIPTIFFASFAIAINVNFIPLYMGMKTEEERSNFTSNLFSLCSLFSFIVCLFISFFPQQVLGLFASSLPDETFYYAVTMLRIVAISAIPVVLERLFQAYLQANGYFASTALTGIVSNLILLASVGLATKDTFFLLSGGVVCAQTVVMFMMLVNAKQVGFKYLKKLDYKDPAIKSMLVLTLPLIIGQLAGDMSLLVDRNLATRVGTGVLSGLSYAELLATAFSSVVMNAMTTATFPTFSKLAAKDTMDEFTENFRKYLRLLCYVLCPISIFMVVFASDVVSCILEHGSLQPSAAIIITDCTICYSIGIIPLGIRHYLIRGFYSLCDTKTPEYISVFSLLCNIGLSVWSVEVYEHVGIALSTSISHVIACILLEFWLYRKISSSNASLLYFDIIQIVAISSIPAVAIYWFSHVHLFIDSVLYRLLLEGVLYFISYVGLLFILRRSLFNQILLVMRKRMPKSEI